MSDRFSWLEYDGAPDRPPPGRLSSDTDYALADRFLQEARRLFAEGDYEPALRQYSAVLREVRDAEEAWAGQVRCLVAMDERQEALVWARKAYEKLPESVQVMSAQALAVATSGHVPEGLTLSERAVSRARDEHVESATVILLERGACLLMAGQAANAEACFEEVRQRHPHDADWLQRIAILYLEWGEPAVAARELARALELCPSRAYLWLLASRASRRLNLQSKAESELEQALALRDDYALARREQRLYRQQEARRCWIATVAFGRPDHPAVQALRQWRDEYWMPHPLGRRAAALYARTAPVVAGALRRMPRSQNLLRRWLWRLVQFLER